MKILYIVRDIERNWVEEVILNNISNKFGFFLLSLKTFAEVHNCSLNKFLNANLEDSYDHIIIDAKILNTKQDLKLALPRLLSLKKKISITVSFDNFKNIKSLYQLLHMHQCTNNIKNIFIFNAHRDYFQNKKFQKLTNINIVMSHYGLGLSKIRNNEISKIKKKFDNENNTQNSLFFSGATNKLRSTRRSIINVINNLNIPKTKVITYDSYDPRKKILTPEHYINETLRSKINLVLAGQFDNLTYRFYEVSFLNKFYIIDKHFLDFEVSKYYKNIDSFVFKDAKDLSEMINFYLANPKDLKEVQLQQSYSFNSFYNFDKHGKELLKYIK